MARKVVAISDRKADLLSIISCVKVHRSRPVMLFLEELLERDEVFTEAAWAVCTVSSHWSLKKESIPLLQRMKKMTKDKKLIDELNNRIKDYSK